jgi:hypothetical protein
MRFCAGMIYKAAAQGEFLFLIICEIEPPVT